MVYVEPRGFSIVAEMNFRLVKVPVDENEVAYMRRR